MTRSSLMVPAAFFVLAAVAHLFAFKTDPLILIAALFMIAVVFEAMWAGSAGQKVSIFGFLLNFTASTAAIVLVEVYADSLLT